MTNQKQKVKNVISQAFSSLGINTGHDLLDSLTEMVFEAMSGEGRYYHTPEHALALSDEKRPLQSLAAVFHDLVYYQVDQGFSPEVWKLIGPFVTRNRHGEPKFKLRNNVPADDLSFHMLVDIFGLSGGEELFRNGGSNELLSALVMAKKLEHMVPNKLIVQIASCIEGTIPFRAKDEEGDSSFEKLAQRLRKVTEKYDIQLSPEEIEDTIQEAVIFANCDVQNFSDRNTALFLNNTWKLLPEANPALRDGAVYSLRDYRVALQEMEAFIRSIKAGDVLHEYKGIPAQAEIEEKQLNVEKNLKIGKEYLEIKLLIIAILEGLAEISGGDGPITEFLGNIRKDGKVRLNLESEIANKDTPTPGFDPDGELSKLLETGRKSPVDFTDIKTAPLASYLYKMVGMEKIGDYLKSAQGMFTGKINPVEFLQRLDPAILKACVDIISQFAVTRREKLMSIDWTSV